MVILIKMQAIMDRLKYFQDIYVDIFKYIINDV
jgi:hypothetical protein